MTEEWRPVVGWETRYEVSSRGRVRRGSVVLKVWKNGDGYVLARLSQPRAVVRVHRMVGAAFVPNPDKKPFINHLDCDPSNNQPTNLEWCTQAENLQHAHALGRMQRDYWRGRRSPNAGVSPEVVNEIRIEYSQVGTPWERLAIRHGISKRTVGRIIRRQSYV